MSQRELFDDQAAKQRQKGGQGGKLLPVNLPEAKTDARDAVGKVIEAELAFANPLAAGLVARCQKCKGTQFVDVRLKHAPHNGQSVRRDCARCGWTLGFPLWYGQAEAME